MIKFSSEESQHQVVEITPGLELGAMENKQGDMVEVRGVARLIRVVRKVFFK